MAIRPLNQTGLHMVRSNPHQRIHFADGTIYPDRKGRKSRRAKKLPNANNHRYVPAFGSRSKYIPHNGAREMARRLNHVG
jgi:hypothetical protein